MRMSFVLMKQALKWHSITLKVLVHGPCKSQSGMNHDAGMLEEKGSRNEHKDREKRKLASSVKASSSGGGWG